MAPLWAATGDGVARIEDGRAEVVLRGSGARCIAARDGVVYAGGRGIWRRDNGDWARAAFEGDVFSIAIAADGTAYAGTEPSALFRSRDDGETWEELESLQDIPSRPNWSFPPRPWTSHVRWIAPNPRQPELLLVGIELGGLMRSTDGGETWADHAPGAQPDVHSLGWHPTGEHAYEAGGGGAAWSFDRGETWQAADEGRDRHYVWGLAVGDEPDDWWVSASTGPFAAHGDRDAQARIYRWRGEAWEDVSGPLRSMPYALRLVDGELQAGLRDGTLLRDGQPVELEGDPIESILALA
jgi:photosystem II stability/assembly factor-like uncharacterized protein